MAIVFVGKLLVVKVKYLLLRNGWYYYQRRIPRDVAPHYPKGQQRKIVDALNTRSPVIAAKKAARLAKEHEDYWARLRGDKTKGEHHVRAAATALLNRHGLEPGDQERAKADDEIDVLIDVFRDSQIEPDREAYAAGDEQVYDHAHPENYLAPIKLESLRQLYGETRFLASDALKLYLSLHDRGDDKRFGRDIDLAFNRLYEIVGDLPLQDYRRTHANEYRDALLNQGQRTKTVHRRIGVIRTVFNTAIRERELGIKNNFAGVIIPKLGADARKRLPVANDEHRLIVQACRDKDDDIRWIVAILADTGARLQEIAGLQLQDIVLDHTPPYVSIQPNAARGVKTKASRRRVPLVGDALWAAKRVVEASSPDQKYAFVRYSRDGKCAGNAVSAAISKWLKEVGVKKSAHSFRHAIRDRLREVEAPKEIQDAVGGWGKHEIGEQYGEGHSLARLAEWLVKIVE